MSEENGNVNVSATETQTETAVDNSSATETEQATANEGEKQTETKVDNQQQAGTDEPKITNEEALDSFTFSDDFGFDEEQKKNALDVMKTFGVQTKAQAQNVVDFLTRVDKSRAEAEEKSKQEMLERWDKALDDDKDFSKNYEQNIDLANKALKQYGGDELDKWLTQTGFNRHPEIVKMFYRIGKDLSEAKVLTGSQGSANVLQHDKYGNAKFNLQQSFGEK